MLSKPNVLIEVGGSQNIAASLKGTSVVVVVIVISGSSDQGLSGSIGTNDHALTGSSVKVPTNGDSTVNVMSRIAGITTGDKSKLIGVAWEFACGGGGT
jgi:hypothetical protein